MSLFHTASSHNNFCESTMAPKGAYVPHPFIVARIKEPLLIDNHTYVSEPPLKEEKRRLWYSDVLIPCSIAGTTFTFMGLLPRHVKKPYSLRSFFPSYAECEPLVFTINPLILASQRIVYYNPLTPLVMTQYILNG